MIKIGKWFFALVVFFLVCPLFVHAQQAPVELNFFFSSTCPHCAKEKIFLQDLQAKYPQLVINRFDISKNESIDKITFFYGQYAVPQDQQGMVPANFIGDKYFIGFNEQAGVDLERYVGHLFGAPESTSSPEIVRSQVTLPVIGKLDIHAMSPLALSIILGTLDGFNPCALMALGILLAFLVSTGMRQRVVLIGGTFILVSAVVYFLFISAWFNLFLALSNVKYITIVIGVVTLIFGAYILRDYFNDLICKLCEIDGKETLLGKWQKKMFTKMAAITMKQMSVPVLILAVAVVSAGLNAIELVCSFGFPLAFTKILTAQNLPVASYYFYLIIYIIFYCLLECIIFGVAVISMRVTKIGDKYMQGAKLVSGIALILLALVMLLRPGLLLL